jgi:PAS domain S-box-containing protein
MTSESPKLRRTTDTTIGSLDQSELYRRLVQGVKDYAIFALDPAGVVSSWNEGARHLKGYGADEIIGRHFSTFYPDEDKDKPPRELQIARAEGRFEEEGWRVRKDGSRFWANVLITPLYDNDGTLIGFAKVTRDLTERRELEKQRLADLERLVGENAARRAAETNAAALTALAQAADSARAEAELLRAEAESANEAKSAFLAVMSHELRTPINAILGYTELFADEIVGTLNVEQRRHLERVRMSARHLLGLIENVLTVSHVEAGKEQLNAASVDACALARESAHLVAPAAAAKGLSYEVEIPPEPCWISSDATKVRQILTNLLTNAVKFTERGTVSLTMQHDGSTLRFIVRDTGQGITPDDRDRIFDRFWQAKTSKTQRSGGVGLGLAVVRELSAILGGSVTVESEVGTGSTFTISLPTR